MEQLFRSSKSIRSGKWISGWLVIAFIIQLMLGMTLNNNKVSATTPTASSNWQYVDSGGLNSTTSTGADMPSMAEFNNKLYVAWSQVPESGNSTNPGSRSIYVKEYDPNAKTWTNVVGSNGLFVQEGKDAAAVRMIAFNGALYAVWQEYAVLKDTNGNDVTKSQIRAMKYDGSNWTRIDGDGLVGLNVDPLTFASFPVVAVFNGNLYVSWEESGSSAGRSRSLIQVKKYDGNSWTSAGPDGLNMKSTTMAHISHLMVFNNNLYVAWSEYGDQVGQIRVKQYNEAANAWTSVDGGGEHGLNLDPLHFAQAPVLSVFNNELYVAWIESPSNTGSGGIIHVRKYDESAKTWTSADGNSNGLNMDPSSLGILYQMRQFDNAMYALWGEYPRSGGQIRLKYYDGENWRSADGGGASGLNDPSRDLSTADLFDFNNELYAAWVERDRANYNHNWIRISKVANSPVFYKMTKIADQEATALTEGYALGTQQTLTIPVTNTGTGVLENLSATLGGTNANAFDIITSPISPLAARGGATTLAIKAHDGLPAGTYTTTVTLSATNMQDVTFTVTQAVNVPDAPANPQHLIAIGGDGHVVLNWRTVTDAVYYDVYMATASGQYGEAPIATVTNTTYDVQNLKNRTTYYFVVKAGDATSLSAASNEANATPRSSDTTAPTVTTLSPANNGTNVAIDANLTLTFSENVTAAAGKNINIYNKSTNSIVETIAADDATKVTFSGTKVTINPTTDLGYNTGYYVQIDAGAFKDAADNDHAGISDKTTWNFATMADPSIMSIVAGLPFPSVDGKTKLYVSRTPRPGDSFKYRNFGSAAVSVPNAGEIVGTEYVTLPADGIIPATNGDHIVVVEVDTAGKVVMRGQTTAVATSTTGPTPGVSVTGVTLEPSAFTLTVDGHSETLTAKLSPSNATNKSVIWTSSDPAVATVDNSGVVNPVGVGTATITVTTLDGSKKSTATVTVSATPSKNANLRNLTLSMASISPGFTADGTTYVATVSDTTASIQVTPTKDQVDASITVNGQPVDSGAASLAIPLLVGSNKIDIVVTAGDGTTSKLYTITVTRQSAGTGEGSSSNTTETILVDVAAGDKDVVSQIEIERTSNADGTKSDKVTFSPDKAMETVNKTKSAGTDTVRILLPDTKDEVKEVRVDLPLQAIKAVADGGLSLQIYTNNGFITIPNHSLQNMNPDLYFRIVPIKQESERKQVEDRAKKEQVVKEALGDGSIQIVGRPMTIETNMRSREVQITLPMDRALLPQDAKAKAKFLADLVIFIEHSNGEKVLVRPELGEYPDGRLALTFTVEKFSTFTMLNMENWAAYLAGQQGANTNAKGSHTAYMNGYPDHTFKPDNSLTRAEMAAILSRVLDLSQSDAAIAYPDVAKEHWADGVIAQVGQTELMRGYPDGTFQPEGAITRAEMAAIVAMLMKLTGVPNQNFKDVTGHWADQAIAQVSQAGYMTGYSDGSFQPDKALTRAEAVATINRVLKRGPLYGITIKTWADVADDYWALYEIEEASQNHKYIARPKGGEELDK